MRLENEYIIDVTMEQPEAKTVARPMHGRDGKAAEANRKELKEYKWAAEEAQSMGKEAEGGESAADDYGDLRGLHDDEEGEDGDG